MTNSLIIILSAVQHSLLKYGHCVCREEKRKKKIETPVVGFNGEATGSPWQGNCITWPNTRCDVIYNRVSHTLACVTQSWLVWGECLAQGLSTNRVFFYTYTQGTQQSPQRPRIHFSKQQLSGSDDSDRWFMGLCIAMDTASAYCDTEIWNSYTLKLCYTNTDDDITVNVFLAAEAKKSCQ